MKTSEGRIQNQMKSQVKATCFKDSLFTKLNKIAIFTSKFSVFVLPVLASIDEINYAY